MVFNVTIIRQFVPYITLYLVTILHYYLLQSTLKSTLISTLTTSHLTPLQYRSDILCLPLVLIAWIVLSWLTYKMQLYLRTQSIPSVGNNPI